MLTPQNIKLWDSGGPRCLGTWARLLKGPSRWPIQHAVGGPAWPEAQPRARVRVASCHLHCSGLTSFASMETQKSELWERKRDIGFTVKAELVVAALRVVLVFLPACSSLPSSHLSVAVRLQGGCLGLPLCEDVRPA